MADRDRNLRRGDLVEVRSPAEILATLDERGMLGGVPFMPEMVQFCGQRFVVDARTEKTCDTVTATSRRLPDCVLLEDLRCDGTLHDGCQADCRIFWNEAWLRPARSSDNTSAADSTAGAALFDLAVKNATYPTPGNVTTYKYMCQATAHRGASQPLQTWDARTYLREYRSGNVSLARFVRVLARAAFQQMLFKLRFRGPGPVPLPPHATSSPSLQPLGLEAGEVVRVKPKASITSTLDEHGNYHDIWFDDEHVPFCGRTFRVHRRVERYINDSTGDMVEPKDYVTLDNVVCTGERSLGRWFCPRAFYAPWSEGWLERVDSESLRASVCGTEAQSPDH